MKKYSLKIIVILAFILQIISPASGFRDISESMPPIFHIFGYSDAVSTLWDLWTVNILCLSEQQKKSIIQATKKLEPLNSEIEGLINNKKSQEKKNALIAALDKNQSIDINLLIESNTLFNQSLLPAERYQKICSDIVDDIADILTRNQLLILGIDPTQGLQPSAFVLVTKIAEMSDQQFSSSKSSLVQELMKMMQHSLEEININSSQFHSILDNARNSLKNGPNATSPNHLMQAIIIAIYQAFKWEPEETIIANSRDTIAHLFCRFGECQLLAVQ